MSSQATVHSVEALKDFRVALALYSDDTLAALGAVDAEVRRTIRWLEQDRPAYWQDQIKRRRELVSQARAEVFRRQLQKKPDHNPAMSEQKENLRKAEASLQDAEKRLILVRKWQPRLQHAALEYHASVQRLKDLSGGDLIGCGQPAASSHRRPGGLPSPPAAVRPRPGDGLATGLGPDGVDRHEGPRRSPGVRASHRSRPRRGRSRSARRDRAGSRLDGRGRRAGEIRIVRLIDLTDVDTHRPGPDRGNIRWLVPKFSPARPA